MTVSSNPYASKVYAEHPIVSWPLDDDLSYVSLITEADRDLTSFWTLSAGTAALLEDFPGAPFPNSPISQITGADPAPAVFEMISPDIDFTSVNNGSLDSVSIGMNLYTSSTVNYYEFGYRWFNGVGYDEIVTRFTNTAFDTWLRLQTTMTMEDETVQLVFRAEFFDTSSPDYGFIMNGLTVGQWSEHTALVSLGAQIQDLPSEISYLMPSSGAGFPVYPYGVSDSVGYIISDTYYGTLAARNIGVPMVFGSENSTRLTRANGDDPSIVFPGHGVLNDSGRYSSLTFEFWLRIDNRYSFPRRIWGPLIGWDGLYVGGNIITLRVGNQFKSYDVSEWYRPMLIDMTFTPNGASLMINGEVVASLEYSSADLELALEEEDYVGFYCDSEDMMPMFEIDCVSIMPYAISSQIAKRRFVWGQGVDSVENINTSFLGTTALIDFPYSNYSAVKSYPDTARFDQGHYKNLSVSQTEISMPEYSLPEFHLGEKTLAELYADNADWLGGDPMVSDYRPPMSFRVTEDWVDPCYMKFPNLNIANSKIEGVYVVCRDSDDELFEPILKIVNKNTGEYIRIFSEEGEMYHQVRIDNIVDTFSVMGYVSGDRVTVGYISSR
jgi:hypothetical protein